MAHKLRLLVAVCAEDLGPLGLKRASSLSSLLPSNQEAKGADHLAFAAFKPVAASTVVSIKWPKTTSGFRDCPRPCRSLLRM